ncbi:MAG: GGDEF domain-containing protein [Oryzomonas sp.]|uniref:GGDEF domain-containing protein n=1 Tax=Oryzomonas sp. TaxID=2855186 RepID=UPI0028409D94|nr:GGDEF domain-containing protein [Oryzomonas sp.]MDR3580236.1 GGDEF domain-containing protein [Oryzomonas sp.]
MEKEVARRTEQLEQLMLTDPLTGVGNRRMLIKRLEEEVVRAQRYQRPLTVAFFDIDHFKNINDTYGHSSGDMVLSRVAESLKSGLRDCDLLGRFGGEEFVVLLPETTMDKASKVAERMRADIEHMRLPQITRSITASVGLAELQDNESGEDLLERSDRALYRAKADGRNCCCVDEI